MPLTADALDRLRSFTDGEIMYGIDGNVIGVQFSKGKTSFELFSLVGAQRLSLFIISKDLRFQMEFPADTLEIFDHESLPTMLFKHVATGDNTLSIIRHTNMYSIDPIIPFLSTEEH